MYENNGMETVAPLVAGYNVWVSRLNYKDYDKFQCREPTMIHAAAGYLPESLLIRLTPDARLFDYDDPEYQPTSAVIGIFFHEYIHYLHNISTVSGVVTFINTIDLWRWFRRTFNSELISRGSDSLAVECKERLCALVTYLDAVRRDGSPKLKYILNPKSLRITSAKLQCAASQATQPAEPLLHAIVCDAHVFDHDDNEEHCVLHVGTLEILECAAWLLEKRMVLALDATAKVNLPPTFPNRVVESLAAFLEPSLSEEAVLACALAALQSSDAPEALLQVLRIAGRISRDGNNPLLELRKTVLQNLASCRSQLDNQLQKLEQEFNGANAFAVSVRGVVGVAQDVFDRRATEPFFEFDLVSKVAAKPNGFVQVLREIVPCAVVQERRGDENDLQRDFLFSFQPLQSNQAIDQEAALRIVHSAFHFMSAHKVRQGFSATSEIGQRRCPFFTCCNLRLRQQEPDICRETPWLSATWKQWGSPSCWYGSGVRITQPPTP
jgi:hypothetical protein